jgi:hypothetical protein
VTGRLAGAIVIFGFGNVREIGDMDEGVVEGGEDTSDAEDELT